MHYKKSQTSMETAFSRLRAQLRTMNDFNLPRASRRSDLPLAQLDSLSGVEVSRFSRQIGARFGTAPWKAQPTADRGMDLSAEALAQEWWRSLESFMKQSIRAEINAVSPWRQGGGSASKGQAAADYAAMLSRYGRRYL